MNKPQRTQSLSRPSCVPALPAADELQHRLFRCFEGCASGVSMKSRFNRRDHQLRFFKSSSPKTDQACPPWSHLHVPITIRYGTSLSASHKLVRAHLGHPAPTASHLPQRLQGRVVRQGLCKMLRPGIADLVQVKAVRVA
jgi:hypothetical protein